LKSCYFTEHVNRNSSGASIPGGAILCTGYFRADHRLLSRFNNDPSFIKLADTYISKIYFDNTHLDHIEGFPDRTEAEKMLGFPILVIFFLSFHPT
uniref:Peptidase S1 domain-containing protein n=1 Tax=Haemonchus contortus TaxID=6289 RepID=A0A7I4YZ77_HAECO